MTLGSWNVKLICLPLVARKLLLCGNIPFFSFLLSKRVREIWWMCDRPLISDAIFAYFSHSVIIHEHGMKNCVKNTSIHTHYTHCAIQIPFNKQIDFIEAVSSDLCQNSHSTNIILWWNNQQNKMENRFDPCSFDVLTTINGPYVSYRSSK